MVTDKKDTGKTRLTNFFGGLGYISIAFQWLWVSATILLPLFNDSNLREWFIPETNPEQPALPIPTPEVSPVISAFVLVIAILFIIFVIIYIIRTIPKSIGKTGQKITQTSGKVAASYVAKNKNLSVVEKKRLTIEFTWLTKLILTLLPVLLLFIPIDPGADIQREVILVFGVFCGLMTLLWFALQYLTAKIKKVDQNKLW